MVTFPTIIIQGEQIANLYLNSHLQAEQKTMFMLHILLQNVNHVIEFVFSKTTQTLHRTLLHNKAF